MKKTFLIICLIWGIFINLNTKAQNTGLPKELTQIIDAPHFFRIMFYNCENFFDIEDDSLTNDNEFLPDGDKNWNKNRYFTKRDQISKVITAIGGWTPPDLVGLCEIENYNILYDLTHHSSLYMSEYSIIHHESPDNRGIDVALLYRKNSFKPLITEFIKISYPDSNASTRDILYTKGIIHQQDTLNIFINHWPSRWGGQLESEDRRLIVATVLRHKIDSIFSISPNANIIIMGDFNDEPGNKSLIEVLKAKPGIENIEPSSLYNLSYTLQHDRNQGSYKYNGYWVILDQIIISGNLLLKTGRMYTSIEDAHIFNAPFLLEDDENNVGKKPYRTYAGYSYLGGFSDHLPVFIDLKKDKAN